MDGRHGVTGPKDDGKVPIGIGRGIWHSVSMGVAQNRFSHFMITKMMLNCKWASNNNRSEFGFVEWEVRLLDTYPNWRQDMNARGQALRLEYFTVGYNLAEAAASLVAGSLAGSIALVGFGLDSIVESLSGLGLIWRLKRRGQYSDAEERDVESQAVRFVGVTFWILGLYVLFESVRTIWLKEHPQPSTFGLIIALCSLVVMPWLGLKKYRIGKALGLESLKADSKETFVCAVLSLSLFIGLAANRLFGFWLADPLTGLVISGFLFVEGYELLFEKEDSSGTESD